MLEKIFGSELKVKILNLFFSQDSSFTISYQEIAKKLSLKGLIWRRELNELVELQLLIEIESKQEQQPSVLKTKDLKTKNKENSKKNAKKTKKEEDVSLKLNNKFFLYPEIKSLLIKSKVISTNKLFKSIEEACRPKLLLLTGKFSANKDAVVDLLIVGDIPRRTFSKLISEVEKAIGEEINYSIMTEEEFKYRRFIMDIFIYNVINSDNIVLVGNIDDLVMIKKPEQS